MVKKQSTSDLTCEKKIPKKVRCMRGDSCACFVGIMVEACDTNDRIPVLFFICCGIR